MTFRKIVFLGTILILGASSARATRLYGAILTTGMGNISATGMTFPDSTIVKTPTSPDSPYFDQSSGAVSSRGTDGFNLFDTSANMHYVSGASDTTVNKNGNYTNRSKASLTFASATAATPVLFEQIIENGDTLDVYLTNVYGVVVGAKEVTSGTGKNKVVLTPATYGAFDADAFVTLNGVDQSYGLFQLKDQDTGPGNNTFNASFTAFLPEPSALALLGTGMLGMATLLFRSRRVG